MIVDASFAERRMVPRFDVAPISVEWMVKSTELDSRDAAIGAVPPRAGLIVNVSATGVAMLVYGEFPPRIRDILTLFDDHGEAEASVIWVERVEVDAMVASHEPDETPLVAHRLGLQFSNLTEPLAQRMGDYAAQLQQASVADRLTAVTA